MFVSQNIRSSQTAYCYTDQKTSAGRGIAVPRNSLTRYTARHLRIKRLVQFILVGAVYHNALTTCVTLLCRACLDEITCVAVMYLTLRTGCERYGRKNPLPYPISERSHVGNLRQIRKQGKGRSPKRKENRRLSFLFAPAAGRGTFPPSADGESPAEVQRKTLRPERDEHACAVRVPRAAGAEKCCPDRANSLRGSCILAGRCRNSLRCG